MRLLEALTMVLAISAVPTAPAEKQLPLIEVPARANSARPYFALIISGDGGWAKIDKSISEKLSAGGVPVVGLNALEYFWKKREPETLARDLISVIEK